MTGGPRKRFIGASVNLLVHPARFPLASTDKSMAKRDRYKFCFGPWNISEGQDPYGPTTRPPQTFDWKLQ